MCKFLPGRWVHVRLDYERVGRSSMQGMEGLVLVGCLKEPALRTVCLEDDQHLLVVCYFPGWYDGHGHVFGETLTWITEGVDFRSCWLLPCHHLEVVPDRPPQYQTMTAYIDAEYNGHA